ncbi:MAG TPA: M20/M25/M40 family metallo-hydrolase [Planctomycetota bacterium]|nr:M20/M25/M40 family metallo-hydrolase [Planctomycetota bacterium]
MPRGTSAALLSLGLTVFAFSLGATRAQSNGADAVAALYSGSAERLIGAALEDDTGYRRLAYLSDRIGNRLSGSASLDRAIAWALSEMEKDGLDNVHKEKVMVPHWVRGEESLELLEPTERRVALLGLGDSVGTPPEGITAEVVVVHDFDELEALGEAKVKGKVVLYDAPFKTYGETVAYRVNGPSRAAKLGAVATLVRSITPVSLSTPHTGMLHYDPTQPKVPAAAITIEAASTLARMQERGERIRVRLRMGARMLEDAESANVIAEVRGRELPDEVVVLGGHIDSWDVGTGSSDDGGGILCSWEAVRLVKKLGLRPRRTLRVVLWTNEENGTRGAKAYREAHASEKHVLAIESDSGVARPFGFGMAKEASPKARERVSSIAPLLAGIGADRIGPNGGGADVEPLGKDGAPIMGLDVDETHYFDWHHTEADTFDKIDRLSFGRCVASMAVMGYVSADLP